MRYIWDPAKDAANQAKHGMSLSEGVRVLELPAVFQVTQFDDGHSDHEDRWLTLGLVDRGVLLVVHADVADDEVRIISVRRAGAAERAAYFKALQETT